MDLMPPPLLSDTETATQASPLAGPAPQPPPSTSRWGGLAQPAALLGITAGLSAYVYAVDPNEYAVFPACPLHAATGLDCPVCGSTRAMHALFHGDLGGALSHNVLLIVLLPVLAYLFVAWTAGRVGYTLPRLWRPWMKWGVAALALGFLVVRNLPFEAFTYLDAATGP